MIFHDTHFNIGNLPCKSQSCASLRKFCANVVPDMIINNSWRRYVSALFPWIIVYIPKNQHKIRLSEKKSNLDIEKLRKYAIIDIKKEVGCKDAYTI